MNKKFIIWQIILISLIILFFFLNWKGAVVVTVIIETIAIYSKFRKKEENQYCLPAPVAKKLKIISPQVQMEGDILSKFMMMLGLCLTMGYTILFTSQSWWFKGFLIFDLLAGLSLFFFALTTSFQQYNSYMNTIKMMSQIEVPKETKGLDSSISLKGGSQ